MKVVYILAGAAAIMTVADIIAVKMSKNTEKRLNNKINDLAGVVKTMKKERIDDWFESASDILTSHQESIDRLEEEVYDGRIDIYYKSVLGVIERMKKLENKLDNLGNKVEEDSDERK